MKTNRSPGYDDISFNAINNVFEFVVEPLRYTFSNSLAQGTFPEEMKIARITPMCKGRDKENVVNYRPLSVLPSFSKILGRIMYKKLYLYLSENNLLYNKHFGFQKGHSTDHANVQLTSQIREMFNKNIYTLGVFIDLSKAFDTLNHKIFLKKLSHYGIKSKSLDWFTCYLSNRKQSTGYNFNSKSTLLDIVSGAPQGSILGPLVFLRFISSMKAIGWWYKNVLFVERWKLLADNTKMFYLWKDVHSLFNTVNYELWNISHWFNSNKLSINTDKTIFILFHKVRQRDNSPLVLPTLKINNTFIKRIDRIKIEKSYKSYWEQNIKKPRYLTSNQIFVKPEI